MWDRGLNFEAIQVERVDTLPWIESIEVCTSSGADSDGHGSLKEIHDWLLFKIMVTVVVIWGCVSIILQHSLQSFGYVSPKLSQPYSECTLVGSSLYIITICANGAALFGFSLHISRFHSCSLGILALDP
jgi:hypothetical protein